MSAQTPASRIRLFSARMQLLWATLTNGVRIAGYITALLIGVLARPSLAPAAATGQPVAYALTPNNTVTIIDTGNHQILRTITLSGAGSYIVGAPDGKHIYVTGPDPTNVNPSVVWVIDTQTYTVAASIPLDAFPAGLVISSDGTRVYAASAAGTDFGADVVVIDTASSQAIARVEDTTGNTSRIAISPDGNRVYVATEGGNQGIGSLDVIDTATNAVIASPKVGTGGINQFFWVAVSPDSSKVFAQASDLYSDTGVGGTYMIDAATDKQVGGKVPVGDLDIPLPNSNTMYGTDAGGITVFSTLTNTVVKTIPVATTIQNLALTPSAKELYVSNSNAQSIAIIDTASNVVTGNVAVAGATGLAIVAAPPPFVATQPVVQISVSPATVVIGSNTALAWNTNGASSCTGSGAWSGSVGLAGTSVTSFPTPGVRTFTLTCSGPGGTTTASAKLTVVAGSTLSLSSTDAPVNGSVLVSWQGFAGATICSVTFGSTTLSSPAVSGSVSTGILTRPGSGSVSLSCSGPPGSQAVSQVISAYVPGAPGYTNLVLPDNVYGFGTPGTPPPNGGLGGSGYAFDGPDLQARLPQVTAFGQIMALGSAGQLSAVSGQTIALGSARLTALTFIATAIKGDQLNQKFVVTYSDGTTATFTQSLSDWGGSTAGPYPGENGYDPVTHATTDDAIGALRITPTGAVSGQGFTLNKYQIPLDGTKLATSLQLPNNRNVIIFAVNGTRLPKASAESLATAYNVAALATAGQPSNGAVRLASGYAYDASLLTNGFTGAGQTFTLGAANLPDAASNTTITLAAKTRLGITVLATGLNGKQANQAFTVTYSDGRTTTFTQSVSDWNQPQNFAGETLARNTGFRITPTGARQAGVWNVYAYTFQTDPHRQVVSLTLPKNRNVVVLAVNSLMQ